MVDEVAEVIEYLDGQKLSGSGSYYRACYMVTKYYKRLGYTEGDAFRKVAAWVQKYQLKLPFSLASCVDAAYQNERELRCGTRVRISQTDADTIRMYTTNRQDRRVALALLCCSKAYAGSDGVFGASSCALASWLGMDDSNLRKRQLARLTKLGYAELITDSNSMHGWQKNYFRNSYRFRILVPYSQGGEWELVNNDIRTLYEEVFHEAYDAC